MISSERGAGMRKWIWFIIPIAIIMLASLALILRKDDGKRQDYETKDDYEIIEEDIINFDEETDDETVLPELLPENKDELLTEESEEDDESHTNGEDVELPILPLS